jgi:exopolysaccharide biosynthesis protein
MFDQIKRNLKSFFLIVFAIFILLGVLLFRMLTPKQITDNSTNKETTTTEGKHQNFLDDNFYSNILLEGKGNNKSGHYINVLSDYSCP